MLQCIHTFILLIFLYIFIVEAAAMLMLQSRVIYNRVSFLLLQKKGGRFTDLHTVFIVDTLIHAMSMLIFMILIFFIADQTGLSIINGSK